MKRVVVLLLVGFLTSCAIFEGGEIPKTTIVAIPQDQSARPTLSYSSIALGGMSSTKELPEAAQSIIEGEFTAVVEESSYFSRVAKNDESAAIFVDLTMTDSGNPAALVPAFITGFSLYTIPSWAKSSLELNAVVENSSGLKKSYVLNDSATIVQWLPMMFVFPAKNFSVITEVRKNMYRKLLSDMRDDGFFE